MNDLDMHILISFVGAPLKGDKTYDEVIYRFPDKSEGQKTKFFASNLIERYEPDIVALLGTAGSNWESVLEIANLDENSEFKALEIIDDMRGSMSEKTLNDFQYYLADRVDFDLQLKLIPFPALDLSEQLEILQVMADISENCNQMTLDITHGSRLLPMIGMVAAVYLKSIRNVELQGFWYGAYDWRQKTEGEPGRGYAFDIEGLAALFDWIQALSAHQYSGNFGVFKDLLRDPIQKLNKKIPDNSLSEAAYNERITRDNHAHFHLLQINRLLREEEFSGIESLFQPALKDRLDWARDNNRSARQEQLATYYNEHGDYLRAVIYAKESVITRVCEECELDTREYSNRSRATGILVRNESTELESYSLINSIRNAMAHGTEPSCPRARNCLQNEDELKQAIWNFLNEWRTLPEQVVVDCRSLCL